MTSVDAAGRGEPRLPMRRSPIVWVLVAVAVGLWMVVGLVTLRMDAMAGGMPLSAALFVVTWALMMAAMMLPSLAPVAALYVSLGDGRRVRTAGLMAGYLASWALVGVGALLVVRGATRLADAYPDGARVAAAVAIAACGVYQLTPLKDRCLAHCRSPAGLLLQAARRERWLSDVRVGISHAGWCIGCCWTLMLALVLLGAMSLAWMIAFTAILTLEKTWRHGRRLAMAAGVTLIVIGAAVLADPSLAGILTTDEMAM